MKKSKILNYLVIFDYFLIGFFLGVGKITSSLFYVFFWVFPVVLFMTMLLYFFMVREKIKKKKNRGYFNG